MRREQRAKVRRVSLWFLINLSIFVACYLNYRFQLKHRYLYKTLNIGLCLSRAAAMVINFNLLLVWLPMCKYSLTRLACLAINSIRRQGEEDINEKSQTNSNKIISTPAPTFNNTLKDGGKSFISLSESSTSSKFNANHKVFRKFKTSIRVAFKQLHEWFRISKLNFINSFLIAVDHCKSLHTICATTITIASVIHTVAHLVNVINFSRNYDTFLSNLNMAEFKGQNPLQLLVSVPGITGSLMIIILILMSLSSVDVIRYSSYDMFQIFHRLSVIFVLLLFLHPSSHVLKEQSNVDRHHPDFCHITKPTAKTVLNHNSSLPISSQVFERQQKVPNLLIAPTVPPNEKIVLPASIGGHREEIGSESAPIHQGQASSEKFVITTLSSAATSRVANSTTDLKIIQAARSNDNSSAIIKADTIKIYPRSKRNLLNSSSMSSTNITDSELNYGKSTPIVATNNRKEQGRNVRNIMCLDEKPLFVAQSSICWYVLSIGLSCYLLDLILRKKRRSKSTIQLLKVHLDSEGNLIELFLSSNHKRFSHWLPGQFIYLNCPQIAPYEWHPFTISSMDDKSRHFTLHIKTGGDWTRKLRQKLEFCAQYDMKKQALQHQEHCSISSSLFKMSSHDTKLEFDSCVNLNDSNIIESSSSYLDLDNPVLPNFNCYDEKTGEPQIECTKITRVIHNTATATATSSEEDRVSGCSQVYIIGNRNNCDSILSQHQEHKQQQQKLYSICHKLDREQRSSLSAYEKLNLFIDGPFHSPFERLLEQQVSVCIASGVGWTAFSSVFQCITNNLNSPSTVENRKDWWSKWHNFATSNSTNSIIQNDYSSKIKKLPRTKLHLMVIVTSIEQLKPFYYLALNYFRQIHQECHIEVDNGINPVREITAFITRSSKNDENAKEFYRQENIHYLNDNQDDIVQVNDIFTIKFGKPCFASYLSKFNSIYGRKISIYCCGSYQVKKTVQEICGSLNKRTRAGSLVHYAYHEENF